MSERKTQLHPFVTYLQEKLAKDRGALAALRRGLGCPPGGAPDMFPYVVPWVPEHARPEEEAGYYLIASLFATHPDSCASGNLGGHLASTIQNENEQLSVERRFVALLKAHPDDLGNHLRQAISFLRTKEKPVNWPQLFWDIRSWDDPSGRVQKRWATEFWGRRDHDTEETNETEA